MRALVSNSKPLSGPMRERAIKTDNLCRRRRLRASVRRSKGTTTYRTEPKPKTFDDEHLNLAAQASFHHDGRERTTGASLVLISPYHHGYDATVVNPIRRHQRDGLPFPLCVARVTCPLSISPNPQSPSPTPWRALRPRCLRTLFMVTDERWVVHN